MCSDDEDYQNFSYEDDDNTVDQTHEDRKAPWGSPDFEDDVPPPAGIVFSPRPPVPPVTPPASFPSEKQANPFAQSTQHMPTFTSSNQPAAPQDSPDLTAPPKKRKPKKENIQRKVLNELKKFQFFCHKNTEYYAKVLNGGLEQFLDIASEDFQGFVLDKYMDDPAGPLSFMTLKSIILPLKHHAKNNSKPIERFCRFGMLNNALVWNLGLPTRQCVIIRPDGYEPGQPGDVLLANNEKIHQIQIDQIAASCSGTEACDRFMDVLGIKEAHTRHMFLMVLVSYLFPNISTPILYLHGPAGSGKTTLGKALKSVFDPGDGEFLHNNSLDLALTLNRSGVVLFDNFSSLNGTASDQFCLAYTSGIYTKKKNYTDAETLAIDMKCPLILTSVDIPNIKDDFKARCMFIKVNRSNALKSENEIKHDIKVLLPTVRGELCALASKVLANYHSFKPLSTTRHADFDMLGQAYFEALGLNSSIYEQILLNVKENESVDLIRSRGPLKDFANYVQRQGLCAFTMKDLHNLLINSSENPTYYSSNPASFAKLINQNKALLRNVGIHIFDGSKLSTGRPYIAFTTDYLKTEGALVTRLDLPRLDQNKSFVTEVYTKHTGIVADHLTDPIDRF